MSAPAKKAGRFVAWLAPLLVAAASPSPLTAQSGSVSPPPEAVSAGTLGIAIGIDALRWQEPADLEAAFLDVRRLGAGWLRTDLNWSLVQPTGPEAFDWRGMDRIVELARRNNLRLLPVVGSVPEWARAPGEPGIAPFDVDAFAAFLEEAARRYAPQDIRTWEIWNEPNMTGSWIGPPDAAAYAAVLRAGRDAIRRADPGAQVLLGGLAPAPVTGPEGAVTHVAAVEFLAGVYAAGGAGAFDAVGFHPYSWPLVPADPAPWNGWTMMAGPIHDLMAANGDAGKRIWITEFGAPTSAEGVSQARQAEILEEAVQLATTYPWAGPLFWYSYRDLGEDPSDPEQWYGLVGDGGEPKPAYQTFRSLVGTSADPP